MAIGTTGEPVQEEETRASVCPLDCADTCSLDVVVRDERVVAVRGSRRNPFTRGKLCAKVVAAFPEQAHGPLRLTTPLLRGSDGAFEAIAWSQALDVVHERFSAVIERWGAEAIAPLSYGGPMGLHPSARNRSRQPGPPDRPAGWRAPAW